MAVGGFSTDFNDHTTLQPPTSVPKLVAVAFAEESSAPRSAADPAATAERWRKLLESGKVRPDAIRNLVSELSAAKKPDEVIALLEQSIILGQGQPWMYEVLALTMEIAGRPREDVERVLLSSRDLAAADTESLLFLAAYLARFERYAQAIRCCRQASELQPNRPEPYVAALGYAQRIKDQETSVWAVLGILTNAWGPKELVLRETARGAAAEIRTDWQKQGRLIDLARFETAVRDAERVDLRIRLEWSGAGDLDLEVVEAKGTVCNRDQRYSPGGGILIHDGSGPTPGNCYDEYVCPLGWSGEYRVRVTHSWGTIVGKRATMTVIRSVPGHEPITDTFPIAIGAEPVEVRVLLRHGRRAATAAVQPVSQQQPQRKTRMTVLQQLQPTTLQQLAPATGNPAGAVGYQPVIAMFSEGVSMAAMATVSGDRRYVRINANPVFNNITDVFTFSFQR